MEIRVVEMADKVTLVKPKAKLNYNLSFNTLMTTKMTMMKMVTKSLSVTEKGIYLYR